MDENALIERLQEMRVRGRDIYEVANQLEGWVGPNTEERLAQFLLREGQAASDLADEIVRLRAAQAEAEKDRDYWKVEAEGERAKVAWRDKKAEKLRKAFDDMIMMVDFEKCKITIAFETAEETEAAQKALSEAIGWETIGEPAF